MFYISVMANRFKPTFQNWEGLVPVLSNRQFPRVQAKALETIRE